MKTPPSYVSRCTSQSDSRVSEMRSKCLTTKFGLPRKLLELIGPSLSIVGETPEKEEIVRVEKELSP